MEVLTNSMALLQEMMSKIVTVSPPEHPQYSIITVPVGERAFRIVPLFDNVKALPSSIFHIVERLMRKVRNKTASSMNNPK